MDKKILKINREVIKINIDIEEDHEKYLQKIKDFLDSKMNKAIEEYNFDDIMVIMKKMGLVVDNIEYFNLKKDKNVSKIFCIVLDAIMELEKFEKSTLTEKNYMREIESINSKYQKAISTHEKTLSKIKNIQVDGNIEGQVNIPELPSDVYRRAVYRLVFDVGLNLDDAKVFLEEPLELIFPKKTKTLKIRAINGIEELNDRVIRAIKRDEKTQSLSFQSYKNLPELKSVMNNRTPQELYKMLKDIEASLPFIIKYTKES